VDPARTQPTLSVVIVVHDMARELPRTLASLAPGHQRDIDADAYELIVVDNGSERPLDARLVEAFPGRLRVERLDPAPPSPVRAANRGLELADGELVGLLVDGARMASPGLLDGARRASRVARRSLVTAPAYHLGSVPHMRAAEVGYDQAVEDEMLAGVPWEHDGYELFRVSTPGGSSKRGIFGPMGESSSLFAPPDVWAELGGLDDRFALPGGGLANHDLYRRACALDGIELIVLLGEGTFHQYHGGAATSRRFTWDDMHADYQAIRGVRYRPPGNEPLYVGRVPPQALEHVERSAHEAIARRTGPSRDVR
jgi:glycosyltransferase involved in cell wall biosynthesis